MKRLPVLCLLMLLAACAAHDEIVTQDKEQAIRDFIAVRQLAELNDISTAITDNYEELEAHFVLYKTRRATYLFEFARACHELNEYPVVADERWDSNSIRARADTLRGCRISAIYALSESDVAELQAIGESPGSRN